MLLALVIAIGVGSCQPPGLPVRGPVGEKEPPCTHPKGGWERAWKGVGFVVHDGHAAAGGCRIWLVGEQLTGVVDPYEVGVLLRSDNGGVTFQVAATFPRAYALRRVTFLDDQIGWIVGSTLSRDIVRSGGGFLVHTIDGGHSWAEVALPNSFSSATGVAVSGASLWVSGEIDKESGLAESRDGGKTWNVFRIVSARSRVVITDLSVRGETLIATATDGTKPLIVMRRTSSDAFASLSLSDAAVWMTGLSFIDSNTVYASGYTISSSERTRGLLFRTKDGGKTWQEVSIPSSERVEDVKFLSAQQGYAITTSFTNTVVIMFTRDGGQSWQSASFDSPPAEIPERLFFYGAEFGYAVGGVELFRTRL